MGECECDTRLRSGVEDDNEYWEAEYVRCDYCKKRDELWPELVVDVQCFRDHLNRLGNRTWVREIKRLDDLLARAREVG